MRLSALLEDVAYAEGLKIADLEITSLAYDSRKAGVNSLFVATKGEKTDGNLFIDQAVKRGAIAVISENSRPAGFAGQWVRVSNARQALAMASANFYGRPTQRIQLIGITGTNGKTSTAYLVESILKAGEQRVGLISTVEYRGPEGKLPAERTTPESLDLQVLFSGFIQQGCGFVVMEVSSHALALEQVYASQFRAAVFTNLTQDHLDYHQTMENYFEAKLRLFLGTGFSLPRQSVINRDDPRGKVLEEICQGRCLTYSTTKKADFQLIESQEENSRMMIRIKTPREVLDFKSRLQGDPNRSNILAAVAVCHDLGMDRETLKRGVEECSGIPGRFELIDCSQPFRVFVDYAHTPDALEKILITARNLKPRKLFVLFGCGGERDRTKRPAMGRVAEELSDFCVITSDNPRSEDPLEIISEIEAGFQTKASKYQVEPDRAKAIRDLLQKSEAGDVVVLAGKGHETTQVLADRTIHFNDQEEARLALWEMGYGNKAVRS